MYNIYVGTCWNLGILGILGILGLKALDSLKKLQSDTATVLRGGRWGQIDAVNVVAWFQKLSNRVHNQSQTSVSHILTAVAA